MTGLLLLLGLGVAAFTVGGLFDDNSSSDTDENSGETDERFDDVVVSSELEEALTDALGSNAVEDIEFVDGALNVSAGVGNDTVVGGSGDDQIELGSGADAATGGAGDDVVDLGSGNDIYGSQAAELALSAALGNTELGDDTVSGGSGDDQIIDLFGSNTLDGGAGNDVIDASDSTDEDGVTADRVSGGDGDDVFVVDQGDIVSTGLGNDDVRVLVGDEDGVDAGHELVTIEDFDPNADLLQLGGIFDADDLRIETFEDGGGSTVFLNDIALVRVIGGQALTLADIVVAG